MVRSKAKRWAATIRPHTAAIDAGSNRLGRCILQLVSLQRVAELVVTEAERGGGRALVEAVAPERVFEQLALVSRDRATEVAGRKRRLCAGRDQVVRRRNVLARRLGRRRVGLDGVGGRRRPR